MNQATPPHAFALIRGENNVRLAKPSRLSAVGRLTGSTSMLLALAACGGGGGTGTGGGDTGTGGGGTGGGATAGGFVVKGPLQGAFVFADTNGDGIFNLGEPSTTTGADGSFTLPGAGMAAIVATTNSNTIDQATGLVLNGVTLKAPPESTVVSPLTTLSSFVWDFQRIVYVIPWSDLKGRIGQWRGDLR